MSPDISSAGRPGSVLHRSHRRCVVCGSDHPFGLRLDFTPCDDGSVEAVVDCEPLFQGYPGMVHGGIVSMLLDGAMTNCLFAHGVTAVTAEMAIRYHAPIRVGHELTARARMSDARRSLYSVQAELLQEGEVRATATATFMERPQDTA